MRRIGWAFAAAGAWACLGSDQGPQVFDGAIAKNGGDGQSGVVATALPTPLSVIVRDADGAPAAGVMVRWSVESGGGSIPATSVTDAGGIASAALTLGEASGSQTVRASLDGATGSPITFTETALPGPAVSLAVSAGNGQSGSPGQPLAQPYAVVARDRFGNPVPGVTVTWTVTGGGGSISAATSVTGANGAATVVHTLGPSAGANTLTASAAGLTGSPLTFTSTAVLAPVLVRSLAMPANYGIHDTYVRDGIAFVSNWNAGIWIYDVGNGIRGGSPSNPIQLSTLITSANGVAGGPAVHNAWWFHNPVTGEKRYLFVGQEGPGSIGSSASGDLHVVDVSDLEQPVEVASYRLTGAGAHNFWMDEASQVLFAAFYNGGVVALDVSGTLSGNLASREIARLQPGGSGNTYTWGVMLHQGSLYAIDMVSGFWKLAFDGTSLTAAGGGNNVPERFSSDLWVHGSFAYTGTWGFRSAVGNTLKVWAVGPGAPVLVDSVVTSGIGTVSDVEVSADGKMLIFTAENGSGAGLHVYSLANPGKPAFVTRALVSSGLHTGTLAVINGRTYAFTAKNPSGPALQIYDLTGLVP